AAVMPAPVLGGATLLMFGTVASSGIRIIASQHLDRRGLLVLAISLGAGLAVSFEPGVVKALPVWLQSLMSSGIIAGGLTAMLANLLLPGDREKYVGETPSEVGPDIIEVEEE
ncbi:MAG: solute carrier family 23 protein, partial [Candidatus Rifleibacteriota bacterium]